MAEMTKDYKKFKFLQGNREVNNGHLRELAKSIALYPDLLPERPILVNEDFEIIDGQHRFEACKRLGLPVYYVVGKNLDASSAVALNRNQRNWGLEDYAKSYADSGNQNYKKFLEAVEEYGFTPSITMTYLRGGKVANKTANFRNGEFVINDEEQATHHLEYLQDLAGLFSDFKKGTVAMPALAVFKHPEYDHARMLQKMAMFGDSVFRPYGTYKDIVRNLDDIYNWRQQKDIVHIY